MRDRIELLNHVQGLPREAPRAVPDLDEKDVVTAAKEEPGAGRLTTVAVLDSGVSRHWYLSGRTWPVGGPADGDEWWDLSSPVLPRDTGHGTAVAGVVRQFASRATILSRRVIDRDGASHDDVLAGAIRDLIQYSPDVLNLSLGPGHHDDGSVTATPRTAAAITALQEACGTITVLAAGYKDDHWPQASLTTPGERTVIVGAVQADGSTADFSDDRDVHIWARGVGVLVPFLYWNGRVQSGEAEDQHDAPHTGTDPAPADPAAPAAGEEEPRQFAGWAEWTGTSFAAPAVAGAIADAIGRDGDILDVRQRRLAGLRDVLDTAITLYGGRRVLRAKSSLDGLYTVPTRFGG
jgi:subtilisin family serine protease